MKEGGRSMTDKQICRYTALVARKAEISTAAIVESTGSPNMARSWRK